MSGSLIGSIAGFLPRSSDCKQVIRIGHMSGRSNILWWLESNGYEPTDALVSHLFDVAKSQPRLMSDDEVESVVNGFLN